MATSNPHLNDNAATLTQTRDFFGMTTTEFAKEFARNEQMTELDRAQLRNGIGDGSFTY